MRISYKFRRHAVAWQKSVKGDYPDFRCPIVLEDNQTMLLLDTNYYVHLGADAPSYKILIGEKICFIRTHLIEPFGNPETYGQPYVG